MARFRGSTLPALLLVCSLWSAPGGDLSAQAHAPDGYYVFGGPAIEQGRAVAVMPGGRGYAIAGDIRENGKDDWDVLVIRLDGNFRQMWQRRVGGPGEDHAWGLAGTDDGGVVVSGATSSFGAEGNDILVVKLGPDGAEVWKRLLGGPGDQGRGSVVALPGSGLLVAGWSRSGESGDFRAAKLAADGKIVWEQTYDHWYLEGVNDVAPAPDGTFLLYGEGHAQNDGRMNGQLVVIDAAGDFKRRFCLPEGTYREGYGVAVAPDGRHAVTGPARGENGLRAYVTGFDKTGRQIWSGHYPADRWGIGFGICAVRGGGFCLTGWSLTSERGSDAILVGIGEDGSPRWIRNLGGAQDDKAIRVVEKPDGGFLIVGSTGSFGAGGGEDILLISTNDEGEPVGRGVAKASPR